MEDNLCTYKENSNEPCIKCPKKISTLYMCNLLQKIQLIQDAEEFEKNPDNNKLIVD